MALDVGAVTTYNLRREIRIRALTMTKLTLSVDESVVEQAKRLAKRNRTSVSAMFSHFIQALVRVEAPPPRGGPIARRASGLIRLPDGEDPSDILADALIEKHEP